MPKCGPNSKRCGNTCISRDRTCHKRRQRTSPPVCSIDSRPCGNTCISRDKVCHKGRREPEPLEFIFGR